MCGLDLEKDCLELKESAESELESESGRPPDILAPFPLVPLEKTDMDCVGELTPVKASREAFPTETCIQFKISFH